MPVIDLHEANIRVCTIALTAAAFWCQTRAAGGKREAVILFLSDWSCWINGKYQTRNRCFSLTHLTLTTTRGNHVLSCFVSDQWVLEKKTYTEMFSHDVYLTVRKNPICSDSTFSAPAVIADSVPMRTVEITSHTKGTDIEKGASVQKQSSYIPEQPRRYGHSRWHSPRESWELPT